MKTLITDLLSFLLIILAVNATAVELPASGIDPEALIERLLAVDKKQRDEITDVVFDAEYVEGEDKGDEGFVEKIKFEKKTYLRIFEDTAWFGEEYLSYYKDGELKSQKDLEKEARERTEKRRERGAMDLSYPILSPFYLEKRDDYEITYIGVADDEIESYICHHFKVVSRVEDAQHINGDYYFEAESFNLVRVDFSPAKLVKKTLFKFNQLNMSLLFGPAGEERWLPRQFDIEGKGKAMFFIGVKFAATEYYRNPIINGGISDSVFEVAHDN